MTEISCLLRKKSKVSCTKTAQKSNIFAHAFFTSLLQALQRAEMSALLIYCGGCAKP
jgi:hypothetical protein